MILIAQIAPSPGFLASIGFGSGALEFVINFPHLGRTGLARDEPEWRRGLTWRLGTARNAGFPFRQRAEAPSLARSAGSPR